MIPETANITGYIFKADELSYQVSEDQKMVYLRQLNADTKVELDLASDRAVSVIFPNWTLLDSNYLYPPVGCNLVEVKYRQIDSYNEVFETNCYAE